MGYDGHTISRTATKADERALVVSLWDNQKRVGGGTFHVVAARTFGNDHVLAVRTESDDEDNGRVRAIVCLTFRDNKAGDLYVKDVDEGCGPWRAYPLSDRFMNLLTDTDSEWALEWRNKCRARNALDRELKAAGGATVVFDDDFATSITYTRGDMEENLTGEQVVHLRNRKWAATSPVMGLMSLPRGWKNHIVKINGKPVTM